MSAKRETITDRWDLDKQHKRKPASKARRWLDEDAGEDAGPEMYHIQRREARQERRAA